MTREMELQIQAMQYQIGLLLGPDEEDNDLGWAIDALSDAKAALQAYSRKHPE